MSIRTFLLLLALLPGVRAQESWPGFRGKAEHLIIAVIDGPRWSETWGDPAYTHIPVMAKELAPQGALYTDFRNSGWTYTNCGHAALTTGVYEQIENGGNQLPANPSIFQRFRAVTGKPAEAAWVISSKDKLFILGDTVMPEWKGKFMPRIDAGRPAKGPFGGYRDDIPTMDLVLTVLGEHRPALMIINLRQPDSSGHAKDWKGYLAAIAECDRQMGRLWSYIQADPQLRDKTDLFITNDHGRHLDGVRDAFISHGDDCEGCRHISCLALGPDIPKGVSIATRRNQTDIAVTVAWLAGIDLPGATGQRMDELIGTLPASVPGPAK